MGHEVVTDRCHNPLIGDKSLDFKYRKHRLLSTIGRLFRGKRPFLSPYYPNLTRYERMMTLGESIQQFIDTRMQTVELFDQRGVVRGEITEAFDTFIVGSDQTWRPKYNFVGGVESYFFSFLEERSVRRVAYAASFGLDNLSEFKTGAFKACGRLLQKFDAVSVREESGVALCRDGFGVEAKRVLDPTMLYTKEHYSFLAFDVKIRRGIMHVYMLDETPVKQTLVEMVAKELELTSVALRPKQSYPTLRINDAKLPSVEEWIAGFRDAEFVVTDSFHGMLFSIIFERRFIAIANDERGAERFLSVARLFGLERCVVRSESLEGMNIRELIPNIDYTYIRERLNELRQESIDFLKEALK